MRLRLLFIAVIWTLAFVSSSAQNVGINVDTPNVQLDIRSLTTVEGAQLQLGTIDQNHMLGLFSGRDDLHFPIVYWRPIDTLLFATFDPYTTTLVNQIMRLLPNGNVGIGSTQPDVKLDVTDIIRTSGNTWPTRGEGMEFAYSPTLEKGYIQVYNRDSARWGDLYLGNGNVGIGTPNPQSALHMNASSYATLIVESVAGDPKFRLTSDASSPLNDWALSMDVSENDNLQWDYDSSPKISLNTSGDLGIGTTHPDVKLDVVDMIRTSGNAWPTSGAGMEFAYDTSLNKGFIQVFDRDASEWGDLYLGDSKVGIGTVSPETRLHIVGPFKTMLSIEAQTNNPGLQLTDDSNFGFSDWVMQMEVGTNDRLVWRYSSTARLALTKTGALVIGTNTTPPDGYRLSVDGKAIAEEMRVQMSGDWPDYVFTQDYDLITIPELEKSIKAIGHLPGVPSSSEVASDGILLGQMNAILLKKVEELTLYIIEQDKRINRLEEQYSVSIQDK